MAKRNMEKRAQTTSGQLEKLDELKDVSNKDTELKDNWGKAEIGLNRIASIIQKSYYSDLKAKYSCTKSCKEGRWAFEVSRWVSDTKENSIEKLSNVYQVLQGENCSFALEYYCDMTGLKTKVVVFSELGQEQLLGQLKGALEGNFPGCITNEETKSKESQTDSEQKLDNQTNVAIVTVLPSDKSEQFRSQSLEKLFDAFQPKSDKEAFRLILLAEPINEISKYRNPIIELHDDISPFAVVHKNTTVSDSHSFSSSANRSLSVGGNLKFVNATGQWGSALAEITGIVTSQGHVIDYQNYAVKYLLELLEKHMEHLDRCLSTGAWRFAAYVISDDRNTAHNVAKTYAALMRGNDSFLEPTSVLVWDDSANAERENAKAIIDSILHGGHPCFKQDNNEGIPKEVSFTALLSGTELAHAMNFPNKSVPGLPVIECASFGRNVVDVDGKTNGDVLLGRIYHQWKVSENTEVHLTRKLLTSHTFVTGSTGSGKSNTIYQLLNKLSPEGANKPKIHFLVIEPAKGEYKNIIGGRDGVKVYGTNPDQTPLLRINPFSFPSGKVHVYEHMDRLVEIFNVCWPMYAAMPAVLKDAVERAYAAAGWDLRRSVNPYGNLFPSFADVLEQIDVVMNESQYSADSKGDYKGALSTRLRSMTNGINGMIFCSNELSDNELFNNNVIVDLSRIGSAETKSLLMGLLVMKLQEHWIGEPSNEELQHVTVLEEAHNLLKRTSTEQTTEGANLIGKSVEMLTNAIAEMRAYGEGFIIADQAPGLLDIAVIRNTNTKIILRLPEFSDRVLVGRACNLKDDQIEELARLKTGVAAVFQNNWIEAVLCEIEKYEEEKTYSYDRTKEERQYPDWKSNLITAIKSGSLGVFLEKFKRSILSSDMPTALKRLLLDWDNAPKPIYCISDLAFDGVALFAEAEKRHIKNAQIPSFLMEQIRVDVEDQELRRIIVLQLLEAQENRHPEDARWQQILERGRSDCL